MIPRHLSYAHMVGFLILLDVALIVGFHSLPF